MALSHLLPEFRIMVTPVGAYYSNGVAPVALTVLLRALCCSLLGGNIKAGGELRYVSVPNYLEHTSGALQTACILTRSSIPPLKVQ